MGVLVVHVVVCTATSDGGGGGLYQNGDLGSRNMRASVGIGGRWRPLGLPLALNPTVGRGPPVS